VISTQLVRVPKLVIMIHRLPGMYLNYSIVKWLLVGDCDYIACGYELHYADVVSCHANSLYST